MIKITYPLSFMGAHMERRTFVQGAFGLAALVLAGGLASVTAQQHDDEAGVFVTPEVASPELADGPVMAAGIRLVEADGNTQGYYGDLHLFTVDERGAQLIRLADGNLTLDELADALDDDVAAVDVASFFVTLGKAGYLQNTVLVNLVERTA